MKVFIKKLTGWTTEISVSNTDTLDIVRQKITEVLPEGERDVSPTQIHLIFRGNGIDQGQLGDHCVTEGSEIMVVIKDRQFIDITIVSGTKRIPLNVEECETIENVKEMLSQREGYSLDEQILLFNQRELVGGRLTHHGICDGSVLQLKLKTIQIFVKDFQGKLHTLEVRSSDTVDHLKSLVQGKTGVTPSQQILTYEGRQLQSGQLLRAYNIRKHSTLHLTGRLRGG